MQSIARMGGLFFLTGVLFARGVGAEWIRGFSLGDCVREADIILTGDLSGQGTLTVSQVLKGKAPQKKLDLRWERHFTEETGFRHTEPQRVIVFLDKYGRTIGESESIVGRSDGKLLVFSGGTTTGGPQPRWVVLPDEGFDDVIRILIETNQKIKVLEELPRSQERALGLLAFLEKYGVNRCALWDFKWMVIGALRPADTREVEALLTALENAGDDGKRIMILDVVSHLSSAASVRERISNFTSHRYSRPVRDAAQKIFKTLEQDEKLGRRRRE
jgi:hypothetical protein